MKAAYIERHGGPEVLKYGDLPDPVAEPGEVVVDIHAASVNGADWRCAPATTPADASSPTCWGAISPASSAPSARASRTCVGDPVFAVCDVGPGGHLRREDRHQGRHRRQEAREPQSHVDAAALALAGLTALVAVEDTLKLKAGETILIQGGAGGVASFAIQLAKHIGARVITTASAANHRLRRAASAPIR